MIKAKFKFDSIPNYSIKLLRFFLLKKPYFSHSRIGHSMILFSRRNN